MPDAPFRPDRSIALVGLMGAGKSTVGRRLASRLGLPFSDVDREIEQAAARSVAEIFESFGETAFREGERRVIARLVEGPPQVIATGGGAFIDARTRALLLDSCTVIWLDSDPAMLAERVARRDHRPLLRGKDPLLYLRALAAERNPFYAQAHIALRSEDMPHEEMVERIVQALAAREGAR